MSLQSSRKSLKWVAIKTDDDLRWGTWWDVVGRHWAKSWESRVPAGVPRVPLGWSGAALPAPSPGSHVSRSLLGFP